MKSLNPLQGAGLAALQAPEQGAADAFEQVLAALTPDLAAPQASAAIALPQVNDAKPAPAEPAPLGNVKDVKPVDIAQRLPRPVAVAVADLELAKPVAVRPDAEQIEKPAAPPSTDDKEPVAVVAPVRPVPAIVAKPDPDKIVAAVDKPAVQAPAAAATVEASKAAEVPAELAEATVRAAAPAAKPQAEAKTQTKADAKPDAELDAKAQSSIRLDAKPDAKAQPGIRLDAEPGTRLDAKPDAEAQPGISLDAKPDAKAPSDARSDGVRPVAAKAQPNVVVLDKTPRTAPQPIVQDATPVQEIAHDDTPQQPAAMSAREQSAPAPCEQHQAQAPQPAHQAAQAETGAPMPASMHAAAPAVAHAAAPAHPAALQPSGPQSSDPQPNVKALAAQIVAKASAGTKSFEIRLDPPELGRVEVRLTVSHDGKAEATLTAERPETVALLQRDSQNLERTLKEAGLDVSNSSLNFSLKGEQQGQGDGGGASRAHTRSLSHAVVARSEAVNASLANQHRALADGRLDIFV